jgi:hypothetical protein
VAYFARVVDGYVVKVHVLADPVITDGAGVMQETLGQAFLADLHGYVPSELLQCSYDGSFRAHYPVEGFTYDVTRDAFIPSTPYASWVLDEATCLWVAPTPKPDGDYVWDEQAGDWVEA